MRCQRGGFECEGPKDITFVPGTIVKSRRSGNRATEPEEGSQNQKDIDRQIHQLIRPKSTDVEIYICYTRKHLRRGAAIDLVLNETQPSDLVKAATATDKSQIFHQALLGFGIIFFGAKHRQTWITDRGYAVHGVALKQLNQALSDPGCYTRDEVILSVAVLAILECLVPTGPRNYLNHMVGLERLLELRGAGSQYSPISTALYKSVRHMIIFASLRLRKPSILARPEWKRVLRTDCSEEECQEQDLYDVLADCTVLIAECDNILGRREFDIESDAWQRNRIEQKALALLTFLHSWKKRWDSDKRNTYFETPSTLDKPESTQEHPEDNLQSSVTIFHFQNQTAAVMLMFYKTALIYVLRVLASLAPGKEGLAIDQSFIQHSFEGGVHQGDSWKYLNDEHATAEQSAAWDICRCIPYYASVQKSLLDSDPSPIVHWAITTAWRTLCENESIEGKWMMGFLKGESVDIVAKGVWRG